LSRSPIKTEEKPARREKHQTGLVGNTIQGFLSSGLINEITLTVVPVILGDGIALFGYLHQDIELTHLRTIEFDFGFVQTTYSTKK